MENQEIIMSFNIKYKILKLFFPNITKKFKITKF